MTQREINEKANWKERSKSPPRVPGIPWKSFILTLGTTASLVKVGNSTGCTAGLLIMRLCPTFLFFPSQFTAVYQRSLLISAAGRRVKNPNSETLSSRGEWIEEMGSQRWWCSVKVEPRISSFLFIFAFWFKYNQANKIGKWEEKEKQENYWPLIITPFWTLYTVSSPNRITIILYIFLLYNFFIIITTNFLTNIRILTNFKTIKQFHQKYMKIYIFLNL